MAYAALVSLAQTIDLILNHHQDYISSQEKNQIICMKRYTILLQEFLEDFPDKASSFEGRIRELTHGAEDIIEYSLWEHINESRYASLDSSVGPLKSKSPYQPKCELLRHHLYKLNKVTKEIESIAVKVVEIRNSTVEDERVGESTVAGSSSRVAPVHKEAMVGLDNDLMEMKCRLCRESSKLEIVPVVGMGGIGKTTLARNVYNDPLIMEHFDIRVWVTVSQDYNVQEIVSGILDSMKELEAKNESMKEHNVHQNLKGRKYLIVIDDIWSIKAWDDLKLMFPDDGNGSRIMLTTRLSDVARYADSFSPFHDMRPMDDDQSWNLLRHKVFKQDPCPAELEYIGKMIARSCRGLPLAVVVISGILAVDQTKVAWVNIAKDVKSAISSNDEQFDKILSLSYTHLPHHLRPCFLYMGGFPEDYEMRVSILIKLWVAEGFLKPDGSRSFEEIAEEYLEDLVKRSLVLVTKRKFNGRIKILGIHDLMREMCIRKAQEQNFILHVRGLLQQGTRIPHRVSIIDSDLDFLENIYGSTIRTIICLKHGLKCARCSLEYFRLLKILAVSNTYEFFYKNDSHLCSPSEVFELFHLRYLAFVDWPFDIPSSISNLQNLQTLIIGPKSYYGRRDAPIFLHKLPTEIWRMPQLRHLLFYYGLLPVQEESTFALENLQTLSGVINFVCTQKILKMIPNLKKQGITYSTGWDRGSQVCEEEQCKEDYELHNLKYLQQLENLKLNVKGRLPYRWEKVNPAFPRSMKKLTLSGLGLSWKDMKIVGSLPNLEVLKLRDYACVGNIWETIEGEFSQLKFLLIDQSKLKQWITESSDHFPRLKCLVLHRCFYLSEIPDSIGEIPTLELIEVDAHNKSLVDSAKQIQDYQQSCENDALQVRCA